MKNLNPLAATGLGRILLHTLCLLRHRENFGWPGLRREFTFVGALAPSYAACANSPGTRWRPALGLPLAFLLAFLVFQPSQMLATSMVGWHPEFVATIGRGLDLKNADVIKPPAAIIDVGQPTLYSGTGEADTPPIQTNYSPITHLLPVHWHFHWHSLLRKSPVLSSVK